MSTFSLIPILAYLGLILFALVKAYPRSGAPSSTQYSLGGRTFSPLAITLTVAATMVGPGFSLAVIEQAQKFGLLYFFLYLLPMIWMAIFGVIFAPRINARFEEIKCETLGDFIQSSFSGPARIVVGAITLLQMIVIAGLILAAGANILDGAFGIPQHFGLLTIGIFVGFYSAFGGFDVILRTDKWQFGLLAFVALSALISGFFGVRGEISFNELFWPAELSSLDGASILNEAFLLFIGEAFIAVYVIRAIAARSPASARKGFILASGVGVLWFALMTAIGIVSVASGKVVANPFSGLLSLMFANGLLADLILGISVVAILCIIMSTLDSVLNAGAMAFFKDVLSFSSEGANYGILRVLAFVVSVGGITVAGIESSLLGLLLLAYKIWVPTVVVPLGVAFLFPGRKLGGLAFFVMFCSGILGYYCSPFISDSLPRAAGGLVCSLMAALLVFPRRRYVPT